MGVFSDIGSFLGGPTGSAIGSLLDTHHKNASIARAGADRIQGFDQGIDATQANFGKVTDMLAPYTTNGGNASNALATLLGIGGGDTGGAIDALKDSPLYKSLFHNGQETVLQNAAATGGLRGGNTEHSLFNLGTDTLAKVYQSMMDNLSGVANLGAKTGLGYGELSGNESSLLSKLFAGKGQAASDMVLGKVQSTAGNGGTMDAIGKLFGDSGTGSASSFINSLFGNGGGLPASQSINTLSPEDYSNLIATVPF